MPLESLGLPLDISGVERETGLSKDLPRMWERRYGFPEPGRGEHGERRYTATEVAKLRAVKRLMDVGIRPGTIVRCAIEELNLLANQRLERGDAQPVSAALNDVVALPGVTMRPDCGTRSHPAGVVPIRDLGATIAALQAWRASAAAPAPAMPDA